MHLFNLGCLSNPRRNGATHKDEIAVMRETFVKRIQGTKLMAKYEAAVRDFRKNVKGRG
jgi:hypothetical protein